MSELTRRDLIRVGAFAGAGLIVPAALGAEQSKPFRVVHLTDMHVEPERRGGEGYAAALESLENLSPPADLLITGGDHVMDTTDSNLARAKLQWNLFQQTMSHTKLPWRPMLGNHDIFGWGLKSMDAKTVGYGKSLALDQLKLPKSYYSFDAAGWHFVVLDSMTRRDDTYLAQIDPEQFEWLAADLAAVAPTTPIIVFSHIPILAACVFFDGDDRLGDKGWNIPDAWMHRDIIRLTQLLTQCKVKLAVSGHIHLLDRVDYNGVTYLCDGAVCGAWWKGSYHETPEGYGIIDLHPDGRFQHQYHSYGWTASKE